MGTILFNCYSLEEKNKQTKNIVLPYLVKFYILEIYFCYVLEHKWKPPPYFNIFDVAGDCQE